MPIEKRSSLRVRILIGSATALGPGKVDLLEAIASTGSISAAARAMGMSYRRAWLLVDTMNHCFKSDLVETVVGGPGGGGAPGHERCSPCCVRGPPPPPPPRLTIKIFEVAALSVCECYLA